MLRRWPVQHKRLCAWGVVLALLAGPLVPATPVRALTQTGGPVLISVGGDGTLGDGDSFAVSLSADGRYAAFASDATNLVPNDTNGVRDIFVRDRDADNDGVFDEQDEPGAVSTVRVSVGSDGVEGTDPWSYGSYRPVISGDGRYVAFQSYADNLVEGDTNGVSDIFVHDLRTRTTERVSVADAAYASAQGNRESSSPSLSFDGRYVAFASGASNLVGGDTNETTDVFVRDRQAGTTERVSVSGAVYGSVEGNLGSQEPAISTDGRYVAFSSMATNLVPDADTQFQSQVYLHDRQTGATLLASRSSTTGAPGDRMSWGPSVATGPAGQVAVAFTSQASNLVEGDTATFWDAFMFVYFGACPANSDLKPWEIMRLGSPDERTDDPKVTFSASGQVYLGATSQAALTAGDTNGKADVYVATYDGGGTAPPSGPPPQVLSYQGVFEPSQGVWQDDYDFVSKPGKQLVIDLTQHRITAELPMVLHRPTLLFGIRDSLNAANDPQRNTITISGETNGTVAVPVKFHFTVKQNGIENLIYVSPAAGQVYLDGQQGPTRPFSVSIDATNGIPPDRAFQFLMTGPYTIDAELVREDGTPTGIKVTLEGRVVETHGPRTYFQPILVPGDAADPALADAWSQRAAELADKSARYVPDLLPLKPGGLPTFPRGTRDMRAAIEEKRSGIVDTVRGWFGAGPSPEEVLRAAMNDLLTAGAVLQRADRVVVLLSDTGMDAVGFDFASAFTASQKLIFIRPDRTHSTVAHELVHSMPYLWSSDEMSAQCDMDYHNKGTIKVAHGHRITVGGAENRARQANKLSLMGPTAPDRWIDQCTYWHMVNQLQSPPDPDLVLVRGLLGRDGAEVRGALFPAYQMTGAADLASGAGGDYAIVLRDAGGAELARYPFAPQWNLSIELDQGVDPSRADVSQNLIAFAYRVPAAAGADRIELVGPGNAVLDRLDYSAHAPAVTITTPADGGTVTRSVSGTVYAEWTGTDADGDRLLYSVLYSPDGGQTWYDQSFEQTATALEVPVGAGDSAPMIKVIATDGARSVEAVSGFALAPSSDSGGGGGGGASSPTTTPGATTSGDISPSAGGTVQDSAGTIRLEIPAGAIESVSGGPVKISVTGIAKAEAEEILQAARAPEGVRAIGRVFEFRAETAGGTTVTRFAKPVTFTVALSPADLAGVTDPEKIGLFKLNEDGTLTFVGGRLVDGKLVVQLHGFSRYLLAEVNVAFPDLAGHWARPDVELMASKYVVKGLPDGRFDPEGRVTRAEFAAMLVRALGLPPANGAAVSGAAAGGAAVGGAAAGGGGATFSDVRPGDWYYGELAAAVAAGLIKGYDDGTFRPNDPVTREQAAAMAARALAAAGKAGALAADEVATRPADFADRGEVSPWARDGMALAVKEGIVRGRTAASLAPQAGATRAEAAVMVARFWRHE